MPAAIRIESLIPQPLPDLKRVSLLLRVSGLPAYGLGAVSNPFHFSDMPEPGKEPREREPDPPSPAPNVDLLLETPQGRLEGFILPDLDPRQYNHLLSVLSLPNL